MTPEDLAGRLRTRGYSCRVKRGEVQIKDCAFCSNPRWNLEANPEKGVYSCWACGSSGTVAGLLRDLGMEVPGGLSVNLEEDRKVGHPARDFPTRTRPAWEVPSARAYLRRRGVREAEARRLNLAVCVEEGNPHRGRIIIPLREYWDGRRCGFVSRAYAGGRPPYMREGTCPDSLPGWRGQSEVHVVVEGPFDALAVRRAGYGVAMLLGKGHTEEALAWASRVPEDERIAVALDGDARDRTYSLSGVLGTVRSGIHPVELPPGIDPGDLRPQVVQQLIEMSTQHRQGVTP